MGAGIAVPSVVADVDQHLGAETRELADLVGKDRFVTDEDTVAVAVETEDFALIAGVKRETLPVSLRAKKSRRLKERILRTGRDGSCRNGPHAGRRS